MRLPFVQLRYPYRTMLELPWPPGCRMWPVLLGAYYDIGMAVHFGFGAISVTANGSFPSGRVGDDLMGVAQHLTPLWPQKNWVSSRPLLRSA